MNEYILFAGTNYYPNGGANDFISSFHSIEQAKAHYDLNLRGNFYYDWAHIANRDDMKIVAEYGNQYEDGICVERWRDVV